MMAVIGLLRTRMPAPDGVVRMLRGDLSDAGIEYRDDAGRVLDFHALRHTFITNLARGGVHPKIAQQLARHLTITLTMDRYSHTAVGDLSDALTVLPDSGKPAPAETTQQRATGTLGRAPERTASTESGKMNSASNSAFFDAKPCTSTPRGALPGGGSQTSMGGRKALKNVVLAANKATNERMGALGLEPRTHGLKGRCSTD